MFSRALFSGSKVGPWCSPQTGTGMAVPETQPLFQGRDSVCFPVLSGMWGTDLQPLPYSSSTGHVHLGTTGEERSI